MGQDQWSPGSFVPTFEHFVATESVALQEFAYLITGNREDALDAVQDALLGAYRHWDKVAAGGKAGAYVRRSIANANVSRWRKTRKETTWEDMSRVVEGGAAMPSADGVVDVMWVAEMCDQLPLKQRTAVVMRFYEDASFEEIGDVLGCSEATARSHLHRGVAAMRKNLIKGVS
ncbi:MAG: SigE family RNA polymerase sigma factor [Propionibacteriaceae bacterium]|nr:SigE family RNA polymerase sigma factor [Propionibacteriaceae bacterium]